MSNSERKPRQRFLNARLPAETASGEYAPATLSFSYFESSSSFSPCARARRNSFLHDCRRSGSTTCICLARNASGGSVSASAANAGSRSERMLRLASRNARERAPLRPRLLHAASRRPAAQRAHFLDPRHGARVGVGAVLLVAEYRQALLQRQLEPVAAGDAVAGPVVKVLVRHHAVDAQVVGVGGDIGACEHVLGVEDVEALVLHRAGVEVADRDDLVLVEIEPQAEALLVPLDGALEAVHRPAGLVELARLHVDEELLPLVGVLEHL